MVLNYWNWLVYRSNWNHLSCKLGCTGHLCAHINVLLWLSFDLEYISALNWCLGLSQTLTHSTYAQTTNKSFSHILLWSLFNTRQQRKSCTSIMCLILIRLLAIVKKTPCPHRQEPRLTRKKYCSLTTELDEENQQQQQPCCRNVSKIKSLTDQS